MVCGGRLSVGSDIEAEAQRMSIYIVSPKRIGRPFPINGRANTKTQIREGSQHSQRNGARGATCWGMECEVTKDDMES